MVSISHSWIYLRSLKCECECERPHWFLSRDPWSDRNSSLLAVGRDLITEVELETNLHEVLSFTITEGLLLLSHLRHYAF